MTANAVRVSSTQSLASRLETQRRAPSSGEALPRASLDQIPAWAFASALVVLGALGVAYGLARHRAAFDSLPGLHGAMVCGYVAFGLALLSGLGYRRTLTVLLPIVAIQAAVGVSQGAAWSALVGTEVIVFGAVGLVGVLVAQSRVAMKMRSTYQNISATDENSCRAAPT